MINFHYFSVGSFWIWVYCLANERRFLTD